MGNRPELDVVQHAFAIFSREECTFAALNAFESGDEDLGALYEMFAYLVSLVETDLTLGIRSDVIVPDP